MYLVLFVSSYFTPNNVSEGVRESGKHLSCIIHCLYPFYPQFMGELTELSNLYHTGTGGGVIISLLGH